MLVKESIDKLKEEKSDGLSSAAKGAIAGGAIGTGSALGYTRAVNKNLRTPKGAESIKALKESDPKLYKSMINNAKGKLKLSRKAAVTTAAALGVLGTGLGAGVGSIFD